MARIQSELNEVRTAVERDRALWHSRMDTMEVAVEQTLELVQEVRFDHSWHCSWLYSNEYVQNLSAVRTTQH